MGFCQFLRNDKVGRCSVPGCWSYRQKAERSYQQVRQKVEEVGIAVSVLAAVCAHGAKATVLVHLTDR